MSIYPQVERDWPGPPISGGWKNSRDYLAGEAFVELPFGVVQVSGSDRLTWLHTITTQQLQDLAPGTSTEALVLDPGGHISLAWQMVDDGQCSWLICEQAVAVASFLNALRFRAQVKVTELSETFHVIGFLGHEESFTGKKTAPEATGLCARDSLGLVATELGRVTWVDPWPGPVGDTTTFTTVGNVHPAQDMQLGARCLTVLSHDDLEKLKLTKKQADGGVWEADRIARWRPRLGCEGLPGVLPHELDWLRTAVALHKGCYTGQETVAKLVNRGRPPRRLVFLDLDGGTEDLPAVGAEVRREDTGEEVGTLTSVAYHPFEGPIALALVPRRLDPRLTLLVEGMRASQTVVVDPSGENPRRLDAAKIGGLLGLRARGGSGQCLATKPGQTTPFGKPLVS